ncbi:MAG: hypothetical protein HYX33_01340 [Actinobacteria bacterium]|nr:hypothetical protein [Actinomycetota bacterium]
MSAWLTAIAAVGALFANRALAAIDVSEDARAAMVFLRVVGVSILVVIATLAATGGVTLGAGAAIVLAAAIGVPGIGGARRRVPVAAPPTAETAVHDVARAA